MTGRVNGQWRRGPRWWSVRRGVRFNKTTGPVRLPVTWFCFSTLTVSCQPMPQRGQSRPWATRGWLVGPFDNGLMPTDGSTGCLNMATRGGPGGGRFPMGTRDSLFAASALKQLAGFLSCR